MSTLARQGLLRLLRSVGVGSFKATSGLGHRFICHVGDLAGEGCFYNLGAYRAELTLMAAWCLEDARPVVYDVGANLGFVSTQLAQMLRNRRPQVIAFEPVMSTFSKLKHSIGALDLEDCVRPICCAISDRAGFALIASDDASSQFAQVRSDSENSRCGRNLNWAVTQTLDCAADQLSVHPTVMKVDVEGFEAHVFRGAERLLSRRDAPAVMFEFNPLTLDEVGSSPRALADALAGFAFFYVDDFKGQVVAFGDPVEDITKLSHVCNLFAVPRQHIVTGRWSRCLASLSTINGLALAAGTSARTPPTATARL